MVGIIRLYNDSYGSEESKIYCELQKYFKGILITNNRKILESKHYKSISYSDALNNIEKFNKLIVVDSYDETNNTKSVPQAIRLILEVEQLYFFSSGESTLQKLFLEHKPNIDKAVYRLNNFSIRLNNTDFIKYYGAVERQIKKQEKKFDVCYCGPWTNGRLPFIKEMFKDIKSKVMIGFEHPQFPWFYKTNNYLNYVTLCKTIAILYNDIEEVYKAWHADTITLLDGNVFKMNGLDDSFYFKTADELHAKVLIIANQEPAYKRMLSVQRRQLTKLKRQYGKSTFNWNIVLKQKKEAEQQKQAQLDAIKRKRLESAKKRLKLNNITFEK